MLQKLLRWENSKLKLQFIFDLPPVSTCNRTCPSCYALKAERRFPAVRALRQRNYTHSQLPSFTSAVINELTSTRRSARTVRIHSSGDFYSQAYIDSWSQIATALPQFTFYAFTKQLSRFDFTHLMSLPNVVIIDSLMHGPLNYGPVSRLLPGVFTCPSTSGAPVVCGVSCRYCMSKHAQTHSIQFILH